MPAKLSTTVNKIQLIPNSTNAGIISEFYDYMKNSGASENHQNNRNYIILSSSCEMVDSGIRQQISRLDPLITSLEEFDLEILDKVAINLLDRKKKTPETISAETGEKLEDIKISLEELKLQGIASENKNGGLFSIIANMENLKTLTLRLTKDNQKKYKFMSSPYLDRLLMMNLLNI